MILKMKVRVQGVHTRNPFQTTQGNRLSCRDQEGRRGSEEAVPGTSVFPLSMDKGAWWAAVYGVSQSWTQLK